MTRHQNELTYLRASVQNASAVGLIIVLYDVLIGDLKGAVAAIAKSDIEERSSCLKHAFLVLQQLEGSLDVQNGGQAAVNLSRFYSTVRANTLDAHLKVSADILNRQIQLLFQVRETWAQLDSRTAPTADSAGLTADSVSTQPATPESETRHQLRVNFTA
jgi:flagellar secretion chaperone FliS